MRQARPIVSVMMMPISKPKWSRSPAQRAQGDAFGHVGHVDAGGGHDQALSCFDNAERTTGMHALGHDAHGIGGNGLFALGGGHLHAFGLGDNFRGDDEDVAGLQSGVGFGFRLGLTGSSDQGNEIVAGDDFGDAGNAEDGKTRGHGEHLSPVEVSGLTHPPTLALLRPCVPSAATLPARGRETMNIDAAVLRLPPLDGEGLRVGW